MLFKVGFSKPQRGSVPLKLRTKELSSVSGEQWQCTDPALVSKSLCLFSSFPVLNSLNASILKFCSYFSPIVIFKHFFCVCLHSFLSIPLGNCPCCSFKPFFHPDSPSWSHCPLLRHLCLPPALPGPSSACRPFLGLFFLLPSQDACVFFCLSLSSCMHYCGLSCILHFGKRFKVFFFHACWLKP